MPPRSKPKSVLKNMKPKEREKIRAIYEQLTTKQNGTDEIVIGTDASPAQGNEEQIQTGTMADVKKLVSGIRYLVKDWIPFGMVTMLVAEPGVGKSAFALFGLVHPIITGRDWFSGTKGPKEAGDVLWCDTEGSAAITVQRVIDWKLPIERIRVPFADDPLKSIDLTNEDHLELIEQIINEHKLKMVVIDSLRGSHSSDENNSRVGEVVKRLTEIAERTKTAILLIHHTRKLHIDEELTANSSRGSNAILAMVRSQIGIDKPDKASGWCRLQMLKENLGIKPAPIGLRIHAEGIEFGAAPTKPRHESKRDKAEDWLRENMKPGQWISAKDLTESALEEGFSEPSLRRARHNVGITKPDNIRKVKSGWEWMLPATGRQSNPSSKTPG